MHKKELVKGFSKKTRDEKVNWLQDLANDTKLTQFLDDFRLSNEKMQSAFENFSENTLSNYHLPWGIVPNVVVDDEIFHVPVVIEESSVVAAASKSASFWAQRGGFQVISFDDIKKGQLHFLFKGDREKLIQSWNTIATELRAEIKPLTANMEMRGGGILSLKLRQIEKLGNEYYQMDMEARTGQSMGANFINSVLEECGNQLSKLIERYVPGGRTEILMAILSNYTPGSFVEMNLTCPIHQLTWQKNMEPEVFAAKMKWAADIAIHDTARAVTHNKGIYNGIDAVVLATGNDFRAVEAAGHAYASRDGQYRGLSEVIVDNASFRLRCKIPLALGTVGGLTKLHPLASKTMEVLGNPDSEKLMKIAVAVGMANNFAAMASLVTTGIQKGHMKMHLRNIITSLEIESKYIPIIEEYFKEKTISVKAVRDFAQTLI